jgi:hypothetical protein
MLISFEIEMGVSPVAMMTFAVAMALTYVKRQ